ncbi:aromatic aminobenezylarsenical efflux permease ArsG family transporter [Haloferula sp.]|uniref:aromatic aminobenezylarsenical efflux permease ArsG family transporter n=1 Tax=Haloferula sp. TaxID=2497595 RepID=UPI003C748180
MTYTVILGTGLWLGMLTSVSPCPLATNLAATAYLSRRVDSRKRAIAGTLAYTLGRVAAYVAIAGLLAAGLASAPGISQGLQRWMTPLLGPLLILTGMVLLGLISLPFQSSFTSQASAKKWASRGLAGELVLGFLFALSFCPVSAALFFGSLVPLALGSGWIVLPVTLYGIGTAAPVAGFALVMIFSTRAASQLAGGVSKAQPWILKATGVLLLAAGLYLTARDTLGLLGD